MCQTDLTPPAEAASGYSPWRKVPEVARRARTGTKFIYAEIRKGRLRAARLGHRGDLRIHDDWVEDWLMKLAAPVEVQR